MASEIWNLVNVDGRGNPQGHFNHTSARIAQNTGGNPIAVIVDKGSTIRQIQRQLYMWSLK